MEDLEDESLTSSKYLGKVSIAEDGNVIINPVNPDVTVGSGTRIIICDRGEELIAVIRGLPMTNPKDMEELEDLEVGNRVMMIKPKASAYDPPKGSMGTYKGRNGSSYMVKWDTRYVIWAVVRDQIRKMPGRKEEE